MQLSVKDYAEFLQKWGSYFSHYFNLDVIGDMDSTWNNQDYLEGLGLKPIPVFHYGEPLELVRLLVRQYDYIGIGGMVPIPDSSLNGWLSHIFYDKAGELRFPRVKLHGLGLTTEWLLEKYPFYSVDSTTWIVAKRFGEICTEHGRVKAPENEDALKLNIEWFLGLEKRLYQKTVYLANPRLF